MNLARNITNQSFFSVLHQIQILVFSTIANFIIINNIPREQYGLIGLAGGYFVFISWLAINPETILIQRYSEIKKNMSEYISNLLTFNYMKLLILTFIAYIIGFIVSYKTNNPEFLWIFCLFSLYQLFIITSGQLQFLLKFEFKQQSITKLTFITRINQIAGLSILFLHPSVYVYLVIILFTTIVEIVIYAFALRRIVKFNYVSNVIDTIKLFKEQMSSFTLWHHLNNNLITSIYNIDIVLLGFFASLVTVGNYSIALKVANLSFIIPSLIQNAATLSLSRMEKGPKDSWVIGKMIRISLITSLVQLVLFIFFGKYYINLLSQEYVNEIYLLCVLIMTGTTILNSVRPIISYINSRTSVKFFFYFSILPSFIFSMLSYVALLTKYGVMGLAAANIFNYGFLSLTLFIMLRYQKINLKIDWDFNFEKKLIKSYFQTDK